MIRSFIPICLLALLAACSSTEDGYRPVIDMVLPSSLQPDQPQFDPRFVRLAQRKAKGLEVLLIDFESASLTLLESTRDGVDTWVTPDGATLSTKSGMLVAMKGFGAGLMASDVDQSLAMVTSGRQGVSDRFHTFLDGNEQVTTRTYRCAIEDREIQTVQLNNGPVRTIVVSEDCQSLDQTFQNLYWVLPGNRRIVQTIQWTGEFVGSIATQVVP